MYVSVRGGTHAGWRRPKHAQSRADWRCPNCGARNRYYWLNCPVCGHARPENDKA